MHRTVIVAALLLLTACEPVTPDPVRVRALVLSGNGSYVTQEVTLTTVTDPFRMEGSVAKLIGGARIISDSQDPELQAAQTDAQVAQALLKSTGRPVTANYIEKDGVLWPADFHTWNIVTAYYNFEKAHEYFINVGNLRSEDFGDPATVYYFPEFVIKDTSPDPIKDNALWFAPTQSFMVMPFDELQRAPLAINSGIMSHEYSHMVFNKKVYAGRGLPEALIQWSNGGSTPGANLLKVLDEGLADYHGYGVTCESATGCDPRFLRTSFNDSISNDRDLSKSDRCMDIFLRDQLNNTAVSSFSSQQGLEYKIGSILASALYQAGEGTGQRKVLERAIVSAYSDETANNPGLRQLITLTLNDQTKFNLTSVAAVIIRHITDVPLKTAVCNEFIDHLQIPATDLVGPDLPCPSAAQGGNTCARLPAP